MGADLNDVLPWPRSAIMEMAAEYRKSSIHETIESAKAGVSPAVEASIVQSLSPAAQETLYAVTRWMQPDTIVETGTCNGVSTAVFAEGLHRNAEAGAGGRLYSIDMPFRESDDLEAFRARTSTQFQGACIPDDERPGWLVPDRLSDRWVLRQGKSQVLLPDTLSTLYMSNGASRPGIFLHDSEHSLTCQAMELELAWHALRPAGLIFCDDAGWTAAFETIADKYAVPWAWVDEGMAVMRKPDGSHAAGT